MLSVGRTSVTRREQHTSTRPGAPCGAREGTLTPCTRQCRDKADVGSPVYGLMGRP